MQTVKVGRLVLVCVAFVLAAMPSVPLAQQATFRAGTKLIVQTVSVKDRAGRAVEGLTAPDFVVTEDGEPQEIRFVEYQRLEAPATPTDSAAAETAAIAPPTVVASTNAVIAPSTDGSVKYRDRRLLVLYFDFTALPAADLSRAYASARRYINDQRSPRDLVALMAFEGGAVRVKMDFTDDRARLDDGLQKMVFGDDADGDGIRDPPTDVGTAFGQDDAEFNILNTDRQLSALQTAASMLRSVSEQKALVYFGSGLRLNGVDNQAQLRATTNAALRANVAIYPIDARGLVASAPLGDASIASAGGASVFTGQLAGQQSTASQRSQDSLYALAKDTGGKAFFDDNDLSLGIQQAAQDQISYYVIGYYTSHTANDGKFHRVKVTLAPGRSGELSYRQGYFADKEFARFTAADKERQLEDALMLDNPVTDIPIAMEVNFFQLNSAEYFVPVSVKMAGSELALAQRRGAHRTLIDFIGEVKDEYGVTIQNVRDKLDVRLDDKAAAQLASHPVQYDTGFTLLPGKYLIKILARDSETGRIGTYQAAFTIPNLNREEQRLPMSSVVLSSQQVPLDEAIFTVQKNAALQVNPLVHNGVKLLPSVTRVFRRSRELFVYAQAYERGATSPEPLVSFVSFYRDGQKIHETPPVAVVDALDPRSKAVPVRLTVPLAPLEAGAYDCQLTILHPGGQKVGFWRAPIVVIP